jgi:hypothetical protein
LNGVTLGNAALLLFNGAKTGFHSFVSVVGSSLIIKKNLPFVKNFVIQKSSGRFGKSLRAQPDTNN